MILTCRGRPGQARSPQPSGRPPLGTQGPSVTVWPSLAAGLPEPVLPKCSRCPRWVPGLHTEPCSGQCAAPPHRRLLRKRAQGFPEPSTQGSVEGNSSEMVGGPGGRSRAPGIRAGGVRNRYRKHKKVQLNIIQCSCLHSKWPKSSSFICFQSQGKGHTHTKESIFLLYKNTCCEPKILSGLTIYFLLLNLHLIFSIRKRGTSENITKNVYSKTLKTKKRKEGHRLRRGL